MTSTLRVDSAEDADGPARRLGTVVGDRYRLERVIGAGGMGVVYEARHEFTHRRVAVKVLHKELAASPRATSRFSREARTTASLGHPNIVEVFDGGCDADGALYLVEELLCGADLAREIAARAVSHGELARLCVEALDALAAAHAKGLVHRDIKPENLFVVRDAEGVTRAKLLDVGVVTRVEREGEAALSADEAPLTRTGAIVGTPYFMSPEQARGADVDARADLWSMGAVLFFALTGRHPVEADNYNALIVRLVTQAAPAVRSLRPEVPAALAAVVDRALAIDPEKRWRSAHEMAAALRAFVASQPESPSPAAPPPRPSSRGATVAAAFLVGALSGAFVMGATHRAPASRPTTRALAVTPAAPTPVTLRPAEPAQRASSVTSPVATSSAAPVEPRVSQTTSRDGGAPIAATAQGAVRPVRPRVLPAAAPLRTYE
ncbi:MAG: protein kinase [Polyangiales bacterium]